jgi:hypothetical protein
VALAPTGKRRLSTAHTRSADFGALLRKQSDEYGRLIREANIKAL